MVPGSAHCNEYKCLSHIRWRTDVKSHQGEPGVAPITTDFGIAAKCRFVPTSGLVRCNKNIVRYVVGERPSHWKVGGESGRSNRLRVVGCSSYRMQPSSGQLPRRFAFSMVGIFG